MVLLGQTLEDVNKVMIFQGAFDLSKYVPYKSDIPANNPDGLQSVEGAGAIEGVDGSGLRAPHPGDIVSHINELFFDDPSSVPEKDVIHPSWSWRRASPQDIEDNPELNLTYASILFQDGSWGNASQIYSGDKTPGAHPLGLSEVSTGDMVGRGRGWYHIIGQALDFNPTLLLQDLQNVLNVGNSSTKGMQLCCDATQVEGDTIFDENGLTVPNVATAKIKLNDDGSGSFAGKLGVGTDNPTGNIQVNAQSPIIRLQDTREGNKRLELSMDGILLLPKYLLLKVLLNLL